MRTDVTPTGIAVALAVAVALVVIGMIYRFPVAAPAADAPTALTQRPPNPTAPAMDLPNELPTELTVTDVASGTGAEAKSGAMVAVNYVGMLPDGTVFDASERHGKPITFQLGAGQVIRGWDEGLVGMKVGGKRRLVIPPDMAYGSQGAGGLIPPNATLIFDVELVGVQ